MKGNLRRVRKEDFARVLLTETCPYEVPVLFSNLGFYWHVRKFKDGKSDVADVIKYLFTDYDHSEYSIPLIYKIRKDEDSFRTLSLLHPCAQIRFVDFYQAFDQQILLECRKSVFSIRAPSRIASKYYVKNPRQNINKYRSENVAGLGDESRHRFLSSYFSYNGYTRLYKFFDSQEFIRLEQRFSSFWSLDISKCFDSIYTHSITWALKTKVYSKSNARVKNSFGSILDRLMQACNYNETAGIVIGPETSRVFAEIIFQEVDLDIEKKLSAMDFVCGDSYVIKRYVDDIFIFTTSEADSSKISKVVASCFKEYKLNLNTSKTVKAARPFVTQKTKSLRSVKASLARLTDSLVGQKVGEDAKGFIPKRVFNRNKLKVSFLNDVKSSCINDPDAYDLACGYVISALCNLLVKVTDENIGRVFDDSENKGKYEDFFHIVIELMFHFYTVSPSHKGSVKICMATNLACSFFDAHISEESNSIRSLIYILGNEFFKSSDFIKMKPNKDYALLEALNLLISLKELGDDFSLPRETLKAVVDVSEGRDLTYFEIVTLLYYIGSSNMYPQIKEYVIKNIKKKLLELDDIRQNSEKVHLLMDVFTCPHVPDRLKETLVERLLKQVKKRQPTKIEIDGARTNLGKFPWFISWNGAELMTLLEKKELLKSY
ncbi:antiviral reverse transcriptase Drt3b [Pseudomonas sp. PDM01]|uniref:antiviral reverse transcriptase Drt3b n=1 Tax=Pseudomonas sp. PDM01 TaxID=2769268 RepID=UPI00177E9DA3|nr:antiviral reverse transcriptase Drt3b [Pseudomonas sp. PDM01]MBD9548325.1 RNA-directed DNA polymerase [Pseudomonas sp. PDM01]